jgi:uncharacterized damage-inducible protein DinB
MLANILTEIYERDLAKLKAEIEAYANEGDLWKKDGEISNSAGNLALHLAGNLRHFFGSVLGGTGYVRDRDAEFSLGYVPRGQILAEIDAALVDIKAVLANISDEQLAAPYPIEVFGHPMTSGFFLTHLSTHFNYHLGQINYHRRMTRPNDDSKPVD